VAVSGVFHWFRKRLHGRSGSDFEQRRRNAFESASGLFRLARFFTDDEIEEWSRTWAEPLRTVPFLTHRHEILTIRYEDMLENLSAVLAEVFRFVGTRADDPVVRRCAEGASFAQMTGGRSQGENAAGEHVRKGVSGDWRNWFTRRDGELFEAIAGEDLRRWGYASSPDWWRSLPETLGT
jgi:hypothetical protein